MHSNTTQYRKWALVVALLIGINLLFTYTNFSVLMLLSLIPIVFLGIWFKRNGSSYLIAALATATLLLSWFFRLASLTNENDMLVLCTIAALIWSIAPIIEIVVERNASQTPSKRIQGIRFFLILTSIFLATSSLVASILTTQYFSARDRFIEIQANQLARSSTAETRVLDNLMNNLRVLSSLSSIQDSTFGSNALTHDFVSFLKQHKSYDQIRVLDTNGMEVARTNQGETPEIVPSSRLQDKSHRPYFQQSLKLKKNDVYLSDIDLNREFNQIEVPLKYVLRAVIPIYQGQGKKGYLVINYLMNKSFSNTYLELLDHRGYWFGGTNIKLKYDEREEKSSRIIDVNPQLWKEMSASAEGRLESADAYYLFSRVTINSVTSRNAPTSKFLYLLKKIPQEKLRSEGFKHIRASLSYYGIFVFFFWIAGSLFYRQKIRLALADIKLRSVFDHIPDFIVLTEPDGTLVDWNRSFQLLASPNGAAISGTPLWKFNLWKDKACQKAVNDAILTAEQGISTQFQEEIIRPDNDTENFIVRFQPILDEYGEATYILITGHSISEHLQMKRDLKETNELFEEIKEIARIGTWRSSVETQKIYWDKTIYEIHEVPENTKLKVEEGINFYREDYRPAIQGAINNAIEKQESWDLEAVLVTANGKERWVRAIGYPVFVDNKLIELRGMFMDIDEIKKASIAIEESAHRLRLATKSAKLGVWDWDVRNNVLEWDPSMYEIYGVRQEDFGGAYDAWQKTLHEEDSERVNQEVQLACNDEKEFETHFRIISGDGSVKHIHANAVVLFGEDGSPERMIGINRDISEKVHREEQITALNQSLEQQVMDRTSELNEVKNELEQQLELLDHHALISIADAQGNITYVNDLFCSVSQFSREKMLGRNHRMLKSGVHPDAMYKEMWQIISSGGIWRGDICNRKKDGTFYWVTTVIKPFKNEQGVITKYVSVRFDITELRDAQERLMKESKKLEEANVKLDHANKELETFSYSVSHDLKAPLRALQGFSNNLVDRYSNVLDDTAIRWLNFIRDNANQMSDLIDDILNLSRINQRDLKMSSVTMTDIILRQVQLTKETYPKEAEVTVQTPHSVNCDTVLMESVWLNLINNAFKYSQNKEKVVIKIWSEENEKTITFYIQDNGDGFDMRYYDKLFGVFQRLHSRDEFEGSGVGLANVKRIISRHNGRIHAKGEVGKGSTFWFHLPKN